MAVLLDFEKPLEELLEQLEKAQATHDKGNVDMSDTVAQLTKKINNEKKELYKNLTGWQKVQISRHPDRPYTLDYIAAIAKNFIELHGDRNVGDDKAMVGGLAQIDNQNVMIIGQQKGRTTKERQYRNFGMPNPEGYRKALRLMRMAEKFNMPVICLIDTPGAFPGLEAEERGQGEAIAKRSGRYQAIASVGFFQGRQIVRKTRTILANKGGLKVIVIRKAIHIGLHRKKGFPSLAQVMIWALLRIEICNPAR